MLQWKNSDNDDSADIYRTDVLAKNVSLSP